MKTKLFIKAIVMILFVSGCAEVKREVAKEELIGQYTGKATFTYMHSFVGLSDETKESKGNIYIFKKEDGNTYIKTGDGDIKISGLTLASNGTLFNVPEQRVIDKQGNMRTIHGLQVAELDGLKFDGMLYTESKILHFSYETIINYDYMLGSSDIPVICFYEFIKMD